MDIFSVFTLCGGLAFFLFGMHLMSSSLEKLAGGRLQRMLHKMTDSTVKSMGLGAGITIAIQSSSAMTVMLVGLVNSGIMSLRSTIGVIMGSNIGTTLTPWILSLSGIESDNFFIQLLKPSSFSPMVALLGVIFIMASKRRKRRFWGEVMIGFAILMTGMDLMSGAVAPLTLMPGFAGLLTAFANPLLAVIIGALFTGIIQSSAASVGILQALSMTGSITWNMAIPIIMGQNIGTCVTALLSSIGVTRNAKRVAAVHIWFNVIGTTVLLALWLALNGFIRFAFANGPITAVGIALVHTIFNITTSLLFLPFTAKLEKLALKSVAEKEEKDAPGFIDERLLRQPSFAVDECRNQTMKMARLTRETLYASLDLLDNFSEKAAEKVTQGEDELDMYEDRLGSFMVKLSGSGYSSEKGNTVTGMLKTIGDLERIGDHACSIARVAEELHDKELSFSQHAREELRVVRSAVREIVGLTIAAFENHDQEAARRVEPLEQAIDLLVDEAKTRHVFRLQQGRCTITQGFILSDLLTDYSRVSDHCSNIAVCLIETASASFNTHSYLNEIKYSGQEEFERLFAEYKSKYTLP